MDTTGPARPVLSDSAFRIIVETISIPLLVVDEVGTIIFAGGSVERDFGYEAHELLGRNVLEFTPPEEAERAIQSIDELSRHEELGIGVPTAFPIIRKDGAWTWMAIGAVPLLDPPVQGMTFYFMPWDAQLHFDEFFAALLAGEELDVVLGRLALSIAISLEVVGVSIHHGFDGERFSAVDGAGHPRWIDAVDHGPWHDAVLDGESRYVGAAAFGERAGDLAGLGLGGCWAIPLAPHVGMDPAVMVVWRTTDSPPVRAHDFVVDRSLRYVQLALLRSVEHRTLAFMADHDHLTGVANRARFQRIVERALATGSRDVSILYGDLDGFKAVNDEQGHGAGDEVLIEVAHRLQKAVGEHGEVARIGGDEFTVFVPADATVARRVGEAMVAAFDDPIAVSGQTVRLGISVGMVSGRASSVEKMMRRADAALYAAKHAGGGRVVDAEMAEP